MHLVIKCTSSFPFYIIFYRSLLMPPRSQCQTAQEGNFRYSNSLMTNRCLQSVYYTYFIQTINLYTYNVSLNCNSDCTSCDTPFTTYTDYCVNTTGNSAGDSFELTPAVCLGGYPSTLTPIPNGLSLLISDSSNCSSNSVTVYNVGNYTGCQKWDNAYAEIFKNNGSNTYTVLVGCNSNCTVCSYSSTNTTLNTCNPVESKPISLKLVTSSSLNTCPVAATTTQPRSTTTKPLPSLAYSLTSYHEAGYLGNNTQVCIFGCMHALFHAHQLIIVPHDQRWGFPKRVLFSFQPLRTDSGVQLLPAIPWRRQFQRQNVLQLCVHFMQHQL